MPRKRITPLSEEQVMHAMCIDDAYRVERTLASKRHGATELVTIEGAGPFVRKKIPLPLANRGVWAALAACESPRLPRVIATYDTPDHFVAVCDYVPGDTLEHIMAARKRLTPDEAVTLVAELCEAVNDLHAHGVAHCDVNPTNVIVTADGAHLIDLGIAQMIGQARRADATPLGTWGFAAPEQYGFARADARTDVHAVARVLGYMLCGVRPDDDAYEAALANGRIVPPALGAVARRGAAFEPSTRFQSAAELAQAAQQALAASGSAAARAAEPAQGASAAAKPPQAIPHPYASAFAQPAASVPSSPATPAAAPPSTLSEAKREKLFGIATVLLVCIICGAFLVLNPGNAARNAEDESQLASSSQSSEGSGDSTPSPSQSSASSDQDSASSGKSSSSSSSLLDALLIGPSYAKTPSSNVDASGPLAIVESGCSTDSSGYVHYGFALCNTSADQAITSPEVQIVGRDAEGTILFSRTQALRSLQPGQTLYFGGLAGNGTQPDSVSFAAQTPPDRNVTNATGEPAAFSISNAAEVSDGYGGKNFSGEVTFLGGTLPASAKDGVVVSVILRDESGAIVYGNSSRENRPAEGETTAFQVFGGYLPKHASMEVYAQPW